jgi:hypothetical protein
MRKRAHPERTRSGCGLAGRCELFRSIVHAESAEDDGGRALDDLKAFRQQGCVALVKLDVVARCRAHLQTHGLTHDEGHGLGFGFAHGGGGDGAALGFMQQFVRRLVDQRGELLGLRLAGQQGNPATVGDAQRRGDIFADLKSDVLLCEKGNQPVAIAAYFTADGVLQLRQVHAFGLRVIEDIHGAEAHQHGLRLAVGCPFGLVLPAPVAGDRSKNLDALLAPLHETAQFFPCAESGNAGGGGPLTGDLQNVAERVVVEPRHRAEVGGEGLAVARLKLFHEVVHGLFDQDLGGVVLLRGALLIGGVVAVALRRICSVRREVAAGWAIAGGEGCGAGGWRCHVGAPQVPAQGRFACMREAPA